MKMPDTTKAAVVRMDREQGEFLLAMYLDNLPAIAAGRELSAFPKKLGSAKLFVHPDTLVGTLDYSALRVRQLRFVRSYWLVSHADTHDTRRVAEVHAYIVSQVRSARRQFDANQ
jgi:acetoacetate decarboxylase